MKKLSDGIPAVLNLFGRTIPDIATKSRIIQVKKMWKEAVEDIYKEEALLFLNHTNAVYLLNKNSIKTLIVYVDESIFAAELNAQRELFKLKFLKKFNEAVEDFEIHISRGNYKKQHPYQNEFNKLNNNSIDKILVKELTNQEMLKIEQVTSGIENPTLKSSFKKAMITDMERKKGKDNKNII